MRRGDALVVIAVLATALALGAPGQAACPGVDHVHLTSGGMAFEMFFEEGSDTPLNVEIAISKIGSDTRVLYFDGSWHEVHEPSTVHGSKVSFTEGGSVRIYYRHGDCGEEIQPEMG